MRRVADRPELLDGPLDADVLAGNLRDLARINRWLGGADLSRRAIRELADALPPRWDLSVLDVGTGGADIPLDLLRTWGARWPRLAVTAVDAHGAESVPSDSVTHQTPTPASTNLTQLVPLSVSQERLSVGQDRGATGGPLRVANQRIYRGLGVAVPSRVVYFLGGGYDAFSGVVGIDDAADARASAIFRVVADGQTLFTSPVMHAGQAAISFTARVRGKTRLELLTTDAEDGSDSDYGVWGNPYLRAAAPE